MQTYEETLHWIHHLLAFGMKPGLQRMESMLAELGNPENELKCVHIAGTNGKGSTLTYMRCALEAAGYRVGTFTSPYIEQFNERISVNGIPISDEDLVKVANVVRPVTEKIAATDLGTPTEFEVVTVLAIVFFAEYRDLDIVLFETGLGGRLDSTNVIRPLLTGITNIGFDHTAILGDTLDQIAYEKSGIIKANVPIVTGADQAEALQVIDHRAKQMDAPIFIGGRDFSITDHDVMETGERFSVRTPLEQYEDVRIEMNGTHQVKNAAMAIMMLELLSERSGYVLDKRDLYNGFMKAAWPGRFEKVMTQPTVIIDGAHNKEGIVSLKETLMNHFPDHRKHMIFSALVDKPVDSMLSVLYDAVDQIVFTSFDFPRASSARQLYKECKYDKKDLEEDFPTAIRRQLEWMGEKDLLIITGSLYFISAVRKFFNEENNGTDAQS